MPLDLNKPIRAHGWPDKVESILNTTGRLLFVTQSPYPGDAPRVFFVDPNTGEGRLANTEYGMAVIFENVPEPIVVEPMFVNIYPKESGAAIAWDSKAQADRCAGPGRVLCAKVTLTVTSEGKILSKTEAV